jgi:hypothetical protein
MRALIRGKLMGSWYTCCFCQWDMGDFFSSVYQLVITLLHGYLLDMLSKLTAIVRIKRSKSSPRPLLRAIRKLRLGSEYPVLFRFHGWLMYQQTPKEEFAFGIRTLPAPPRHQKPSGRAEGVQLMHTVRRGACMNGKAAII